MKKHSQKYSIFIRLISLLVLGTFCVQNIVWADPKSSRINASSYQNLQIELMSKPLTDVVAKEFKYQTNKEFFTLIEMLVKGETFSDINAALDYAAEGSGGTRILDINPGIKRDKNTVLRISFLRGIEKNTTFEMVIDGECRSISDLVKNSSLVEIDGKEQIYRMHPAASVETEKGRPTIKSLADSGFEQEPPARSLNEDKRKNEIREILTNFLVEYVSLVREGKLQLGDENLSRYIVAKANAIDLNFGEKLRSILLLTSTGYLEEKQEDELRRLVDLLNREFLIGNGFLIYQVIEKSNFAFFVFEIENIEILSDGTEIVSMKHLTGTGMTEEKPTFYGLYVLNDNRTYIVTDGIMRSSNKIFSTLNSDEDYYEKEDLGLNRRERMRINKVAKQIIDLDFEGEDANSIFEDLKRNFVMHELQHNEIQKSSEILNALNRSRLGRSSNETLALLTHIALGEKTLYQILQVSQGFFIEKGSHYPSEYVINSILSALPEEVLRETGLRKDEISKHRFSWVKKKVALGVLERLTTINEETLKQSARDAYIQIMRTFVEEADESYLTHGTVGEYYSKARSVLTNLFDNSIWKTLVFGQSLFHEMGHLIIDWIQGYAFYFDIREVFDGEVQVGDKYAKSFGGIVGNLVGVGVSLFIILGIDYFAFDVGGIRSYENKIAFEIINAIKGFVLIYVGAINAISFFTETLAFVFANKGDLNSISYYGEEGKKSELDKMHEIGREIGKYGHVIDGGKSTGKSREILIIDYENDKALRKVYRDFVFDIFLTILREEGIIKSIKTFINTVIKEERSNVELTGLAKGKIVEKVFEKIRSIIEHDEKYVDKELSEKFKNKPVLLGEASIAKGKGVCRHKGLVIASILERLIQKGFLRGQVYYRRSTLPTIGRHGWVEYRDSAGTYHTFDKTAIDVGFAEGAHYEEAPNDEERDITLEFSPDLTMIHGFSAREALAPDFDDESVTEPGSSSEDMANRFEFFVEPGEDDEEFPSDSSNDPFAKLDDEDSVINAVNVFDDEEDRVIPPIVDIPESDDEKAKRILTKIVYNFESSISGLGSLNLSMTDEENINKLTQEEHKFLLDYLWEIRDIGIAMPESLKQKLLKDKKHLYKVATGFIDNNTIVDLKTDYDLTDLEIDFLWEVFHKVYPGMTDRDESNISGYVIEQIEARNKEFGYSVDVLDVGCGPKGVAISGLKRKFGKKINAFGVNLRIDEDVQNEGVTLDAANIKELPYGNERFDIAYEKAVLMYFPNEPELIKVFKEIARVLKPGGTFFFHRTKHLNQSVIEKIIREIDGISFRKIDDTYYSMDKEKESDKEIKIVSSEEMLKSIDKDTLIGELASIQMASMGIILKSVSAIDMLIESITDALDAGQVKVIVYDGEIVGFIVQGQESDEKRVFSRNKELNLDFLIGKGLENEEEIKSTIIEHQKASIKSFFTRGGVNKTFKEAISSDVSDSIEFYVDMGLFSNEYLHESAEIIAYNILSFKDVKKANYVFENMSKLLKDLELSDNIKNEYANSPKAVDFVFLVRKAIIDNSYFFGLTEAEAKDLAENRVFEKPENSVKRPNSIEIPVTSNEVLKFVRDNNYGNVDDNSYPVAMEGLTNTITGKIPIRNFEGAFIVGFSKAALVNSRKKVERNYKGALEENAKVKEEVLEKIRDLYKIIRPEINNITLKTIENMIDTSRVQRLNRAIEFYLPQMGRVDINNIVKYYDLIKEVLYSA